MHVKAIGFFYGVTCLAGAGLAWAGHPQERQGFWFGVGAGYGSADAKCDDCGSGDRESGVAGYLKGGWTISDHVLLGSEVNFWTKDQEGVTLNMYNLSGTVTFYPASSSGFFVKGGVGVSFVDTEVRENNTTTTTDLGSGLGLLAGAGYDWRVGRNVSITPSVNYWYGRLGDLSFGGETVARNWKQNVVDLTVGVTFH